MISLDNIRTMVTSTLNDSVAAAGVEETEASIVKNMMLNSIEMSGTEGLYPSLCL